MKKLISNKGGRTIAVLLAVAMVYGSMPVIPANAVEENGTEINVSGGDVSVSRNDAIEPVVSSPEHATVTGNQIITPDNILTDVVNVGEEAVLAFENGDYADGETTEVAVNEFPDFEEKYDFSVKEIADLYGGVITYFVESSDSETEIATIDSSTGELTVRSPGTIVVSVSLEGDENYEDTTISHTLKVMVAPENQGDFVSFAQTEVSYVFGGNGGVVSVLEATKANEEIEGEITYAMDNTDIGLGCAENGEITIEDYDKLGASLVDASGELIVTVTATKEKTETYAEDSAEYNIIITCLETPDAAYSMSEVDGENGWYISNATVTPKDGYKIATTPVPEDFSDAVVFAEPGKDTKYVYLMNENGEITSPIAIDVKIDNQKPDADKMKIEFSELSLIEKVADAIGFYDPNVTITFTAEDDMSGIDYFEWDYTKETDASDVNMGDKTEQKLDVVVEGNVATATLVLPENEATQLRGMISFTATDKAGIISDKVTEEMIIVVDTLSPTMKATFSEKADEIGERIYFKGDAEVTIEVTEANFYAEDVVVKLAKDGEKVTVVTTTWVDNSADEHEGVYTFSEDGEYKVYVSYTDKARNEMEDYESKVLVVDKTQPVVEASFDIPNKKYTVRITEKNFSKDKVTVTGSMTDIKGDAIDFTVEEFTQLLREATWIQEGDTYTCEGTLEATGIFDLEFACEDICGNVGKTSNSLIMDDIAPYDVSIEFSEPIKTIADQILSTLSLGFYNPKKDADVTITFTAYDTGSGVDYFTYGYQKQDGSSDVNLASYSEKLQAVQDQNDKMKFQAQVTLPKEEVDQLRGTISVSATDKSGNESVRVTEEGYVIVVDSISPTMAMEYSAENGKDENINTLYYKEDATVTLVVRESNFFADEVKVSVSKDGGEYESVSSIAWVTVAGTDIHRGTFTLSKDVDGDGDYVICVDYEDYSKNKMDTFFSKTITIDTTIPVLGFEYDSVEQKTTFTVKEHNFRPTDIKVLGTVKELDGTDVTFTVEDITNMFHNGEWTQSGDVYTFVTNEYITGIYDLIISYEDAAKNPAVSKETDTFVVDYDAPNEIKIEYSNPLEESVIEKLLATITLGFYNPDVTVTFIADDTASGVDCFTWGYTKEEDTSDKNRPTDTEEQITTQTLVAVQDAEDKSKFSATLTLTATEAEQLRGYLMVSAKDKYGNESGKVSDTGRVLVVDTITPTMSVEYSVEDTKIDSTAYYSDAMTVIFNVEESNFFAEDVKVSISKDGGEAYAITPSWQDKTTDVHVGTYTLNEDGYYIINVEYKDRSNNSMTKYTSNLKVIDTTAPEMDFVYNQAEQTTEFIVKERNFRPTDIRVDGTIKTIDGKDIEFTTDELQELLHAGEWKQSDDVYTLEMGNYMSGIYNLTLDYKDIVGWDADTYVTETFTIDHDAPTGVKIEYSTPIVKTILEKLTLGFYQSTVDVIFTAYDSDAGVESFNWGYTQQNGSSVINRPTDSESLYNSQIITATQDTVEKSKFTATFTLTATQASQLRGYLSVRATDKFGNVSDKVTDSGNVLVVDNISPKMTVEYSPADRTVETELYYKKNVDMTFTVEEANFFAEDVLVTVTKDNQAPFAITPNWSNISTDIHVGTYTLVEEGHYVVNVEYKDRSDNSMAKYTSNRLTIDTTAPVINVTYLNSSAVNTLKDSEGHNRKYYAGVQTAEITVTEHNFNPEDVIFAITAKDVGGQSLSAESLYRKAEWTTDVTGDIHTMIITFPGDANYSFDVIYTDLAENAAIDYATDYFTVDKLAPEGLAVTYSTSILEEVLEAITFGFYNAKVTVTLTAEDVMSGVNSFVYSYKKAEGVSDVNGERVNETIGSADITYSNGGRTAAVAFEIPKDALGNTSQFNGTVEFVAIDRVGKETAYKDGKRLVVDNIAPTAEVTYNEPVNVADGISYYDGEIEATVVISEANFYEQDVEVLVTKDGGEAYTVIPSWSDNSVDVHMGTFSLTEDGDYTVSVNYVDKSSNVMDTYTSEQMTIDTELINPVITINGTEGNGKAFKEEVVPAVSFSDRNFADYEITLTRTNYGSKNAEVTEKFIADLVKVDEEGGSGTFDTFEKIAENDGIYTLNVTVTDKAGHTSNAEPVIFTVNRFGSVYEYSNYLVDLIANGGAYEKKIEEDLVITEYNADRLVEESLGIEITCDGKPLDTVEYSVSPTINNQVAVGESGWFQYEYTIDKENFATDGVYKVSVSSKDATGNSPENSNYDDKNILFRVDSTAPEITSIVGLEESIVNATEVTVKYTVFDAIGLKSVTVYVDGKQRGDAITDFSADPNNYSGSFTLAENTEAQSVRIVVKDMAENATDTSAEDFTCAYVFNPSVTVSTNFLVRWYANKALFWGTTGGAVAAVGAIGSAIAIRKRKKSK